MARRVFQRNGLPGQRRQIFGIAGDDRPALLFGFRVIVDRLRSTARWATTLTACLCRSSTRQVVGAPRLWSRRGLPSSSLRVSGNTPNCVRSRSPSHVSARRIRSPAKYEEIPAGRLLDRRDSSPSGADRGVSVDAWFRPRPSFHGPVAAVVREVGERLSENLRPHGLRPLDRSDQQVPLPHTQAADTSRSGDPDLIHQPLRRHRAETG